MLELYDVTSLVIDTLNSAETTRLDLKPYNNYGNMSWGAQTQTTFIQGSHQKTSEKDDSNSALFYLFQEVSMLAPPSHCSFSETKSTPKLLGGTTVQDKTEEDGDVFKTLNGSRLQCLSGSHGVNTFKEECGCHDSSCELNSPWKVLNLINLQCERLLHHRDEDKSTPCSVLPAVTLCQSVTAEASTEVDVTELEAETATVQNTETHFDYKTEELPASVEHGNNGRVDLHSVGGQCCVNESGSCGVTGLSEEVKENAFSHPHHSVQECTHPFPNPAFFQHVPSSQQSTDVNSFPSECVSLSKSVLTLDCNANVVTTDPIVDTQQSPFHAVLPSVLSVSCVIKRHNPLPQTGIVGSQPESTHSSVKDKSPHDPLFKPTVSKISSAKFPPEDSPAQKKEIEPQTILKWKTRSRRKQPYPSRSIDIQDPNVQGVTFSMGSELDDSREHCRLLITWKYSKELCKRERKLQPRTRKSYKTSSSDEENDHLTTVPKSKACASCCTRKTPMWRDAEDGTPLCNACGIRYKKYRVRCVSCWHIPRKESNSNSCCLKCGNLVIQISGQRKHTS